MDVTLPEYILQQGLAEYDRPQVPIIPMYNATRLRPGLVVSIKGTVTEVNTIFPFPRYYGKISIL